MNDKSIALIRNIKIKCTFDSTETLDAAALEKALGVFTKAGISVTNSKPFIFKKSVDARKRDDIYIVYTVGVGCENVEENHTDLYNIDYVKVVKPTFENKTGSNEKPVVVGFGPSGMFCALALAKAGLKPLVIERGAEVDKRSELVESYWKTGALDENTNVQFGEGGAGTFSDGKLLTRISDELTGFVLEEFVKHGAPEEIKYLAKPHIGTDNLRKIVKNIRNEIIELGGEVRFLTRLSDIEFDSLGSVCKITVNDNEKFDCHSLFLCIGHSARDTVKMLQSKNVAVEPKPFSVGVRIEHLQEQIDNSLYGRFAGAPSLSKAQYTLSKKFGNRAIYSFCMCPGGVVVASASSNGEIVTNGMSYFARDGKNANSAIAVSVNPDDYGNTVDGAIEFQQGIERKAFELAGNNGSAPIQTLGDFLSDKIGTEPSDILPTYTGKTALRGAKEVFPSFVVDNLKRGIRVFDYDIKGFCTPQAVLTFPETRTSSPVRIVREKNYNACGIPNLYPCGEGAGYAGGITSAAVDGLRAAMSYLEKKVD